ncbi:MAG: DUF2284 domain-containing protein [Dethiobacteria bacterium]|jgi:predicted metal-binding protein|nr:DUF2284 domain-containing protein [Bacillota bacterium]
MLNKEEINRLIKKHGLDDFKWFNASEIVVSRWVRFKCQFGCGSYGKKGCCPPHVPSLESCREFFSEYTDAVLIHFSGYFKNRKEHDKWCRQNDRQLLKLGNDLFHMGYYKSFVIVSSTCRMCRDCPEDDGVCKNRLASRPTAEALGVDVFATVRKLGYPIEVLKDYEQKANRYGFILIE